MPEGIEDNQPWGCAVAVVIVVVSIWLACK